MRTRLTTGAVLAAAVALAGSALAAPSTISLDGVSVSAGVATVAGTVSLGDAGQAVGGVVTSGTPAEGRPAFGAGAELKSASIAPLADGSGLRFTWQLVDLPSGPPPEAVRYTWSFALGDKTFQLQAKRSNVASVTTVDDPQGHVTSAAGGAFQLRGNCVGTFAGTPVPLNNCPHLGFLKGAFDTAKDQVTMELPYGKHGFVRGGVLTPVETASMSITAGYQAVASNTFVSTFINGWAPYYTAPAVELSSGRADDEDPSALTYSGAELSGTSFTGAVPVETGSNAVFARLCEGTSCTYTRKAL